ncbi:B3 domain-containing protein Os05g0481400 isoform X1 [Phoenix dactylifera]|uniref:B3 domain-containing protein Os05g0481400 isoform X1 n=1 Tax=Phoenix dactylifera TaxID=42345 RepID=A0A8B7CNJ2_PHODC|nr:B3 domain-containing protein Os05g0481400 isoform X1 [Phoenix dactylifera]
MADDKNSYEEIRRQRIQENLKHLEDLGISKISQCLLEVAKCEYKLLKCHASPKSKKNLEMTELRRSSRARNPVPSYCDEVGDIDLRSYRKRYSRSDQNGRVYTGRVVSYEEQIGAVQRAEKLQSDLNSNHPSFVKSMLRSHVSSCFWLGLPSKFCKENLPPHEMIMVLEDENGLEYDAIYIGNRTGLSGGWRAFAMDHKLEDGDALVFELVKPDRFKVYIIKAIESQDSDDRIADVESKGTNISTKAEESVEDSTVSQKPVSNNGSFRRAERARKRRPG